jgi:cell division septum initiation protein DivIVA
MTNLTRNFDNFQPFCSPTQLELLETLLEAEDVGYPWNPAQSESDDYFGTVEHQSEIQDLLDEELTVRSQSFYNQLDTLWSNVSAKQQYNPNTAVNLVMQLKENLAKQIAARVPHELIERIAEKASEIFNPKQSMGEQLVSCAQAVLPSWGSDDLTVLARPFAYAMRNSEAQNLETVLDKVGEHDWQTLSEIEQARISVAIAYYALRQITNFQKEG